MTTDPRTFDLDAYRAARQAEAAEAGEVAPPRITLGLHALELPAKLSIAFLGLSDDLDKGDVSAINRAMAMVFGDGWADQPVFEGMDFAELLDVLRWALGLYMGNAGNSPASTA